MSTRPINLVIDAADPRQLGSFWAGLLGWRVAIDPSGEVDVRAPAADGWDLDLVLGPVPDRKVGQNRLHLDLASASDQVQADTVARARELGGEPIDIGQRDVPWVVLADPEGNEFCVREPNARYADTGAVAAILIDAVEPDRLARFWAEATGWPVIPGSDARCVALRAPTGRGPWLEFWSAPRRGEGKNRLHLDVAPPPHGDHRAEVERLLALGASPADVGQDGAVSGVPWVTLADPEGNEFCVLTAREHPPSDYFVD